MAREPEARRVVRPAELGSVEIPWQTLGELVSRRARETPDREAVSFDDGPALTCGELDARSDAIAASYAALGVGRGDRVLTILANSPEQLLSWLAVAKLGAIHVPANTSLREIDLAHVLTTVTPRAAVIGEEFVETYQAAKRVARVDVAHEFATASGIGMGDFGELGHGGRVAPGVEVSPSDPVCVVFTGGTTGRPKGVLRPHFSYMCAGVRFHQAFDPTSEDRHYSAGQMFHIGGQESGFVGPFMNDVPTRLSAWFSASQFWDRVRDQRATITETVGSRIILLLRQPPRPDDGEHRVRVALAGTRDIPADLCQQFRRRFAIPRLVEVYAMSETGGLLFHNDSGDEQDRFVLYSRGWCDAIVADDDGFAVPQMELGEILLRPTVPYSASVGYMGDPGSTVEHWRNLWIHTGDIGRRHPNGGLEFVGRQSHWLRRRGENISAVEVEQVLDAHPDVLESAVVGTSSELGGEDVRAIVVLEPSADPAVVEELFDFCQECLAYFKVPRYIELRTEPLPRTATKREIERHVLRDTPMHEPVERVTRNPRAARGPRP